MWSFLLARSELYMSKVTVVYQDTKGRCRVLINPENIEKYLNKDNVAINPPIEQLLSEGATPDRWYIEGGYIHVKDSKEKHEVSKLDIYDLFLDVMDRKEQMEVWFKLKEEEYIELSNNIVVASGRLDRLDRYIGRINRGLRIVGGLSIVSGICIVGAMWLIK